MAIAPAAACAAETTPLSILQCDFESRSLVELPTAGVYRYAEDPSTHIWCMAWAFDEDEPEIWTPGMPLPERIADHINEKNEFRAWNAAFERIMWREIMHKRWGFLPLRSEQVVDTAAEAAAMSLPRALGNCATALGLAQQKDTEGYNLMLRMARPRSTKGGTVTWWDVPDRLERLYAYCKEDVKTERAVAKALRRLNPAEREMYLLTERMNDTGVRLDTALIIAARTMADEGILRANTSLHEITGGAVGAVSNHQALTAWIRAQGIETDGVSKKAIRDLQETELPAAVRDALTIRADSGRSSIAKLDSMLACVCADGRVRGLFLYHGAGTGRWTGKLVQPHNYPRGEVENVEQFVADILAGDYDLLNFFAHPIVVISSLLRGMLIPSEGKEFIAADYAAIEARVLNWLAGQSDIVAMFARGEDVYKYNATKLYNIPLEAVQKFPHRQLGKAQELGCGFQMGGPKFVTAAKDIYGLTLSAEEAQAAVDAYRASHPKVKQYWHDVQRAAMNAVKMPGVAIPVGPLGNVKYVCVGGYLYCILPSGRPLCYAAPRIVEKLMPWGEMGEALRIMTVNPLTKQWGPSDLYGGLLVENIVQAVARDLMAEGKLRLEQAGYVPVMSIHDEVVSEVERGKGSVSEYESLLAALPAWAEGCPVAAEGWRGVRYRK